MCDYGVHNKVSDMLRINELEAAIQRVRELHKGGYIIDGELDKYTFCDECDVIYPCHTIKALDGEQ